MEYNIKPTKRIYPIKKVIKGKKMTLVIGFVCKQGVALVADTKIVDTEDLDKEIYEPKTASYSTGKTKIIVGAAGFTNLFDEFKRKMEEETTNIQGQSPEHIFDRCRILADVINKRSMDIDPNYCMELLVGISRKGKEHPTLHHINPFGAEKQIRSYMAIGKGQPYVKMFFERYYNGHKDDMNSLIKLSLFCITYTNRIAYETTVGWKERTNEPPEVFMLLNNGTCKKHPLKNWWSFSPALIELTKHLETKLNDEVKELSEKVL